VPLPKASGLTPGAPMRNSVRSRVDRKQSPRGAAGLPPPPRLSRAVAGQRVTSTRAIVLTRDSSCREIAFHLIRPRPSGSLMLCSATPSKGVRAPLALPARRWTPVSRNVQGQSRCVAASPKTEGSHHPRGCLCPWTPCDGEESATCSTCTATSQERDPGPSSFVATEGRAPRSATGS
jgi:hypothetical protein